MEWCLDAKLKCKVWDDARIGRQPVPAPMTGLPKPLVFRIFMRSLAAAGIAALCLGANHVRANDTHYTEIRLN